MNYKKYTMILLIGIVAGIGMASLPASAQVPINASNFSEGTSIANALNQPQRLPEYIRAVYRVGVALTVALATVVMMWGGLQWIMAGGNVSRIENAKSLIYGSVLGLVIALSSFVLLNTINPQIVTPSIVTPNPIENKEIENKERCCNNTETNQISRIGGLIQVPCSAINPVFEEVECPLVGNEGDETIDARELDDRECLEDSDCRGYCPQQCGRWGCSTTEVVVSDCVSNRCVNYTANYTTHIVQSQCSNCNSPGNPCTFN